MLKAIITPILSITLLLLQIPAHAQSDTIVADRPGFSTGTYTVAPGSVNIELGYQYAFNNQGSSNASTSTLPLLDLRTGINDQAELDIIWSGWNSDNSNQTSVSDAAIGGKYRLYTEEHYNLTAMAMVSLPVGSAPASSEHIDPVLALLGDYTHTNGMTMFGVLQSSASTVANKRTFDIQAALGSSWSLNDRLGTFIEAYAFFPQENQLNTNAAFDTGLTYLLHDNLQIDINAGVGLNHNTDHFLGFGVAWRR